MHNGCQFLNIHHDAAVAGDAERLHKVIQDFGEHQRQQVLSILTEENA